MSTKIESGRYEAQNSPKTETKQAFLYASEKKNYNSDTFGHFLCHYRQVSRSIVQYELFLSKSIDK